MSDLLDRVKVGLESIGLEALDCIVYIQMKCSCGKIITIDNSTVVTCNCGIEYNLILGIMRLPV